MMQLNYWGLPCVKVNHDFTSNSVKFQFDFSEIYNIKKTKQTKKHGPVNITHLLFLHGVMKQSHFCCMSLASISYISKQKGVGDARHIPCQVFSLQSGGSTCFNPTENPAHIAGLLWLLF